MPARRVVVQESARFEMPPGVIEHAPSGLTNAERVAWYEAKYAAYPAWLALFIKGGWDYGGLTIEQPELFKPVSSASQKEAK